METIIGTSNRLLEVNLSDRTSHVINVSEEDRRRYLGGKGLGLKLIHEQLAPGVDPLGVDTNHFTGHAYRSFGTAANVSLCNQGGILPVNNFREGAHQWAGDVSGEIMQEKYNTRPSTCLPCKILCGHKGTYPDGSARQIPECETTSLLGSNLDIFDPETISEWNDLCGAMGLDTISTGATLAWVMEAGEKICFSV